MRWLLGLLVLALSSGCATTWGKNLTATLEARNRLIQAYQGKPSSEKDPLYATCGQYTQWIGQPAQRVIECWGQPDSYLVGTQGGGTMVFYAGAADQSEAFSVLLGGKVQHGTSGFRVDLREGKVLEIYKF